MPISDQNVGVGCIDITFYSSARNARTRKAPLICVLLRMICAAVSTPPKLRLAAATTTRTVSCDSLTACLNDRLDQLTLPRENPVSALAKPLNKPKKHLHFQT